MGSGKWWAAAKKANPRNWVTELAVPEGYQLAVDDIMTNPCCKLHCIFVCIQLNVYYLARIAYILPCVRHTTILLHHPWPS